ncbi:ABC transporter ATP-binding protein [Paenibacillus sp. CCS19]|uniref:ABC transporter ATP-binding protein n=1 Tax=Paenibacillus sp. CCS19 TaxID=3158387 RepID=UPI00295EC0A6|nr:ABC transporter ATP-binding protein [Paenibacillus cellulosilyticus]
MNTQQYIIDAKGIVKTYGLIPVIRGVTLQVNRGEIFGLVGPSGSGKSTLLELLMGIRQADEGDIQMLGMDMKKDARKLHHRIGFQLQATVLFERIKVMEALQLFRSYYKKRRDLNEIITMLKLKPFLNQYVRHLSESIQQRVALAIALVNDPDIVFLDEPSAGMDDPRAIDDMWSIIAKLQDEGKTFVMTTQSLDEALEHCDRLAFLMNGTLSMCITSQELMHKLPAGTRTLNEMYAHLAVHRRKGESA